ncbi:MAG: N-acetylmuramic acid 6-phosphate etherase [Myxococcaceae bacterium]
MKPPVKGNGLSPTERVHPRSEDLDLQPLDEIVARLHTEDRVAVEAVGRVLPEVTLAAEWVSESLREGRRLFYVGAGTSGRLGALDAAELPPTFGTAPEQVLALIAGGPEAFARAVEGAEDDESAARAELTRVRLRAKDVVCGISASSTTPFVRSALQFAKKKKCRTVLICCNPTGAEGAYADLVITPLTGPELVAGSTRLKAGTATKLVLNAISTAAMVALGKVYRGRMIDMRPTNAKLRLRAERMVSELAEIELDAARALLDSAKGSIRVALAMHFTGKTAKAAARELQARSLRSLAPRDT